MTFETWPELAEIRAPLPSAQRRSWDNEPYEERYRRQHHDLLAATSAIATAVGYRDTQVSEVVAAAHVSKRVFYEHFSSKDDCFAELVRRVEVASVKRSIALAESLLPGEPHAVIEQLLRSEVATLRSNTGLARALFHWTSTQQGAWGTMPDPQLDLVSHFYAVVARRLGSRLDDATLAATSLVLRHGHVAVLPRLLAEHLDVGMVASIWCTAFGLDVAAPAAPTKPAATRRRS